MWVCLSMCVSLCVFMCVCMRADVSTLSLSQRFKYFDVVVRFDVLFHCVHVLIACICMLLLTMSNSAWLHIILECNITNGYFTT